MQNDKNKDKRFKSKRQSNVIICYRKAPVPQFLASDIQDGEIISAENELKTNESTKEKLKPNDEDSTILRHKNKTENGPKHQTSDKNKRNTSKIAQRKARASFSEVGPQKSKGIRSKGLALYSAGKAIVFQQATLSESYLQINVNKDKIKCIQQ